MMQSQILFEEDLEWCFKNKVRILTPEHLKYPPGLKTGLSYRPQNLYVMGNEEIWLHQPLLSVVGSRHAMPQSLIWLEEALTPLVQGMNVVTVSGGARGVDQKAHQISLRNQKPTVVFLPSGLAKAYPLGFENWYKPIIESGGAIVTPYSPFMPMRKNYFRERNLLIAAISPVTLAIECKRRSGTLLTAAHAAELQRTLAIMPTAPYQPGMGGMDLVMKGEARLVLGPSDLANLIRYDF